MMICEMTYNEDLPVPIGVFYIEKKPTYDTMMLDQINKAKENKVDLQSLIKNSFLNYVILLISVGDVGKHILEFATREDRKFEKIIVNCTITSILFSIIQRRFPVSQ